MPLPRAVLEAEAEANRLHEELIRSRTEQPEGDQADEEQSEQTDPPAPAAVTPPADDGSAKPAGQQDDAEHRFKVLQGKYNSEVPRLAAENRDLKGQLDQLRKDMEKLQAAPPPSLLKPEEVEEYGEGLIDVARRIAREEIAAKQDVIDALQAKVDSLSNTTTAKVETDFFTDLTRLAPDWQTLNENAEFLKWLEEVDELAGEQRFALLSRAEASRDAARTAKFFTAFQKASSSWAAQSQQSLDTQLAPSTNKAPNTPPAKKIWLRSEITEVYNDIRRGKIDPKQQVAIEADLAAASIEGRIR